MAAASCKVFVQGELVRIYGGNRKQVRELAASYNVMSVSDFNIKHNSFAIESKEEVRVIVRFNRN